MSVFFSLSHKLFDERFRAWTKLVVMQSGCSLCASGKPQGRFPHCTPDCLAKLDTAGHLACLICFLIPKDPLLKHSVGPRQQVEELLTSFRL